ncbi:DivIVA domain-containing protein [bacterium]|nr:DivIVA domain-containing protein [bacterium]
MLTPLEISKKVFKTSMAGGYNKREVDEFLQQLREDYEILYRNVIDLKEESNRFKSEIDRYSSTSDQLQKALTIAQKTADEIKVSAERQADLSIMQANIKSQQILQNTETKLKHLNQMYRQFSSEFSSYLETFQKLLTKLDEDSQKVEKQIYNQQEIETGNTSDSEQ